LERRIEECLPKALRIIRPEEHSGVGSKHKHKWQHVEACQRAVENAIREIDSDPKRAITSRIRKQLERELANIDKVLMEWKKTGRDGTVLVRKQRELRAKVAALARRWQKRTTRAAAQKMAAVVLADELMDFGEATIFPSSTMNKKNRHATLAQELYEVATGSKSSVKHQIEQHFKEMVAPSRDQVTDKAGRTRSRRRDQIEVEVVELAETRPTEQAKKKTKVEEAYEARRREWERPKPSD
jgi:hypothetical protein